MKDCKIQAVGEAETTKSQDRNKDGAPAKD